MARNALRKTSLESMEAEIESLLKTLEGLKHDASEETQKTMKTLRGNAESALKHSRSLLSDAYEEVVRHQRLRGDGHTQPGHRCFQQVVEMLEGLPVTQRLGRQPMLSRPGRPSLRPRGRMEHGNMLQSHGWRGFQTIKGVKARAHHRADALLGEHVYLHVRRPRWLCVDQQCVQPRASRIKVTFAR
ncbi:hypothetical protein WR25_16781 [Diploscapter pachys]|uniref:DUF883 domain-containing protein n=1 Tax=Diploscapter pachys TaxID=2018661 RepID=A0A2A2K473_9BILA|nr:hypothetical protein WR25_16781 [Diploscapter pachys]